MNLDLSSSIDSVAPAPAAAAETTSAAPFEAGYLYLGAFPVGLGDRER